MSTWHVLMASTASLFRRRERPTRYLFIWCFSANGKAILPHLSCSMPLIVPSPGSCFFRRRSCGMPPCDHGMIRFTYWTAHSQDAQARHNSNSQQRKEMWASSVRSLSNTSSPPLFKQQYTINPNMRLRKPSNPHPRLI